MPPRAMWRGQIRISLVTVPVRLHTATESASRIHLHQLHGDNCYRRIRYQRTCPAHGPVENDQIVRGYEYEKDRYVVIYQEEMDKIKRASQKVVEIKKFVPTREIDAIYRNNPYYVSPDGAVAEGAYRVIRDAMRDAGVSALGKLVMSGREQVITLEPQHRGMMVNTLRTAEEVREAAPYFEQVKDEDVDRQQLNMAEQLIEQMSGPFDPAEFRDTYQDALLDLIKSKVEGEEAAIEPEEELVQTYNFMDALQRSVDQTSGQPQEEEQTSGKKKKTTRRRKRAS